MRDRRALPPLLLLLVGLALTGCGLVGGGSDGQAATAATSSEPPRTGVTEGDAVRPLQSRGRGIKPGVVETPGGFGLPQVPLPLALALAAGAVAVAAGAGYLWWRSRQTGRQTGQQTGQSGPATAAWQGVAGPAGAAPFGSPSGMATPPPMPHPAAPGSSTPPGAAPPWPGGIPTPPPTAPPTSSTPPTSPTSPTAPLTAPGSPPRPQAPPAVPPPGAPFPAGERQEPSSPGSSDPLAEALTEVAGSGISQALTQQVERLFAEGHPGRAALIEACIGCRDQIAERHPRLAGTLLDGLNRAGVQEIVADGRRFDPRLHEAFGTESTERPELHDIVAETVKGGYADGGRVIRVPKVAVYRYEAPGSETAT